MYFFDSLSVSLLYDLSSLIKQALICYNISTMATKQTNYHNRIVRTHGVMGEASGQGVSLELGDSGIPELFLLSKKWLVKRRHKKVCIS